MIFRHSTFVPEVQFQNKVILNSFGQLNIFQLNGWQYPFTKHLFGVEYFNANQGFARSDIQGNFFIQTNSATFVFALNQTNIEGIYF